MARSKHHKRKPTNKRPNPSWKDIVKENELMLNYYKCQGIVPEEEWETFVQYMKKDLPSTFRITKIRGHASDLLRSLKEGYISKISAEDMKANQDALPAGNTENDSEESEQDFLLEPIKWYPDELAWNSNLSRRFLRRSDILKKLHRFLVEDSECGAITRQEAVSMIPPMLLDVQSHHLVLDMCAAPGSKTAQIIEMMHSDSNELPTGAVVANDADHKRCYLLTHQANRLNSPCVMVTNQDATIFPKLYTKNREDGVSEGDLLKFDRILCDVPCSGDGTIRKNPLMWKKWTPHLGTALHRLQMRILVRGLELLKVGGRLVYSTCSFNPIENEAVLHSVLSKSEGSVELVDCSNELPGLVRRPGMKSWKVFSRNGTEFASMESVDGKPTEGYKESMFPPSEEEAESLNLKYCMRIFPHLQNTGGFFIAVLHKKSELPWQREKIKRSTAKLMPWEDTAGKTPPIQSPPTQTDVDPQKSDVDSFPVEKNGEDGNPDVVDKSGDDNADPSAPPAKKKFRRGMIKEDPFIFLDDNDAELADIRKFYALSTDLPSRQFLIRNNQGFKRHIYLVSEGIHNILSKNDNLKIINTGLRVASRSKFQAGINEHGIEYRLVHDGVYLLSNFIKNRKVKITHSDLVNLVTSGDIPFETLDIPTKEQLNELQMGCVVYHYPAHSGEKNVPLSADIWLCGHYGRKIVQCMLSKEERKHFLRLLGCPIPEELQVKVKGPSWGDSNKESDKGENTEKPVDMAPDEGTLTSDNSIA